MTAELGTRVLKADRDGIAAAARCLQAGGLVAFPTETVYGLGADAANGEAVARLYAAKGRPAFNPLIAHVADVAAARRLAVFDAAAEALAAAFWPGPVTLVLPKRPDCPVSDLALAGLDSVALRVPDHPVAHALLTAFAGPVVAPSANRSGHVSPTTAAHVLSDLRGRIDLVIDGGASGVGVESTIVSCLGEPTLLRPGGLPRAEIERVLGRPLAAAAVPTDDEAPVAPGMLSSHYAPKARLRLNADGVEAGEVLLAFGPPLAHAGAMLNLSPGGDLIEAAANLFSHLRALDASGARNIAVMTIPHDGLGEAINDRLARAAAPRP
ncbi:threonylcarbamoyl-AMP synthase [Pseudolabrys taiwanensis]|uniref:Threonylcarbamoyl-AMP synthase n=1 Tax=Pseudolabrys taiwanensis TaxID=331696 RepID=A0A346A2N2_9HYPH|nr:L-threonylcarbamoyladenylate synthase [Pseudolabrys taiwanensis]AXK83429.1 threonylcarbamoyl-AMP synthase [Pseudolabrys taiwanensis]